MTSAVRTSRFAILLATILLVIWIAVKTDGLEGPERAVSTLNAPRGSAMSETSVTSPQRDTERTKFGTTRRLQARPEQSSRVSGAEIRIRVQNAGTGMPVARADVRMWPPMGQDPVASSGEFMEALRLHRVDSVLAGATSAGRSNEAGKLVLQRTSGQRILVGSSDGLWGFTEFDASVAQEVILPLQPDFGIHVRVIDQYAAPVKGIRVALRAADSVDFAQDLVLATTDVEGACELAHLGWWTEGLGLNLTSYLTVSIAEPIHPPVERELEYGRLTAEPIVLQIPATGSFGVRVHRSQDNSDVELFEVELGVVDPLGIVAHPVTRRAGVHGVVHFPWVSVNRRFSAALVEPECGELITVETNGPTSPGETTHAELQSCATVRLRGRVLDSNGFPIALGVVAAEVDVHSPREYTRRGSLQTDSEGGFQWWIDASAAECGPLRLAMRASDGMDMARGQTPLPSSIKSGMTVVDVGSVSLEGARAIASGEVLNADGFPAAGALVEPYEPMPLTDGAADRWRILAGCSTISDGRGKFELMAFSVPSRLRLRASAATDSSPATEVVMGEPCVLRLERSGGIEGRVEFNQTVPREVLEVTARQLASPETSRIWVDGGWSYVDSGGQFSISGLTAGDYEITVEDRINGDVLARVDVIRVVPGTPTRDPRLDPLVLAQNGFVIRFVDSFGRLVRGVSGRITPDHPDQDPLEFESDSGKIVVLSASRRIGLIAHAPGYLAAVWEALEESGDVTLQRGPVVAAHLSQPPPTLPAGCRLNLTVRYPGLPDWLETNLPFDASGRATGVLLAAGRVRTELWLHCEATVPEWIPVSEERSEWSLIDPGAGQTVISVTLSPGDVNDALTRAGVGRR